MGKLSNYVDVTISLEKYNQELNIWNGDNIHCEILPLEYIWYIDPLLYEALIGRPENEETRLEFENRVQEAMECWNEYIDNIPIGYANLSLNPIVIEDIDTKATISIEEDHTGQIYNPISKTWSWL